MSVSLTWGGSAMPLPAKEGIEIEDAPIVAARRMLSGTLRVDVIAVKAKIDLSWAGLSSAQRGMLKTQFDLGASASLTLPDSQAATVVPVMRSWRESLRYDVRGTAFYNVQIGFEEV
jgi:hypothetical protein